MASRPFPSFLVFKDTDGQFRWHFQESNHKIIASSGEGYYNLADCEHAIGLMRDCRDAELWETQEVTNARR
jgi:uncharacterized protein YegP (UPF0339 family)